MPKNKALPTSDPESIEELWAAGDEVGMTAAIVRKYARVLDMTDSGRDIKPLATGLFEALERYHALKDSDNSDTPLAAILKMAESA